MTHVSREVPRSALPLFMLRCEVCYFEMATVSVQEVFGRRKNLTFVWRRPRAKQRRTDQILRASKSMWRRNELSKASSLSAPLKCIFVTYRVSMACRYSGTSVWESSWRIICQPSRLIHVNYFMLTPRSFFWRFHCSCVSIDSNTSSQKSKLWYCLGSGKYSMTLRYTTSLRHDF